MTTHAQMARVPFAPLDSPRLKHLASAKNRQNGIIAQNSILGGKPSMALSKPTVSSSPNKRSFETYDDADSENVDPTTFDSPSKKSKSHVKPFSFSLGPSKAMPPPPRPSTTSTTTPTRPNMSTPRTPMTAPAGRSPKRKTMGGIQKNRRISAPFSRIDPPFTSRTAMGGGSSLPFSLDAALNGTLNPSTTSITTPATSSSSRNKGATIQESMPKNWFFEIYQDTAEDEASNLMEHSTLTLDLSSDDETATKERDNLGKENTPPEDYDAPTASRSAAVSSPSPAVSQMRVKKSDLIRNKIVSSEDMDDDQRCPLSDLETDPFIPEGLHKDSHIIVVDGTTTAPSATSSVLIPSASKPAPIPSNLKNLFAGPVPFTANNRVASDSATTSAAKHQRGPHHKSDSAKSFMDLPVVTADGKFAGEIFVWEDSSSSASEGNSSLLTATADDAEANGENVLAGTASEN